MADEIPVQVVAWSPDEADAWRPPERLSVSQFADLHRVLVPLTSSEPGRYRSDRTPYGIEWMDSACCPWVRQVTIMASTQVGKTETINNVVLYAVAQDPGPAMVVLPRSIDVPMIGEMRLRPMFEASPRARQEMTNRAHDVKNRQMAFKRSVIYLRSSQSPADLASAPVRYVFADEVDKYPRWSGKEGDPLALALERQNTFWNALAYVTSTPTTREGNVHRHFLDGDQRRYWVPCPHCGKHQVLQWSRVKMGTTELSEMRRTRSAWYECEHCAGKIDDHHKRGMLAGGVWVPLAFSPEQWQAGAREADRTAHRSYHLWAGYSPWLRWSDLAIAFLKAKRDTAAMQNFVNSTLAEVWEEQVEKPLPAQVDAAKLVGWKLGEVPDGCIVATAGVDVQRDHLWAVVRGWGHDGRSWLLWCGRLESFDALHELLRKPWTSSKQPVRLAFIDSRFRREDVLEFVRTHPEARMSVGVSRRTPVDFSTYKLGKHPRTGQALPTSVVVWSITVVRFKDLLAAMMSKPETWHLPSDVPEDYCAHIVSEHKVLVRSGGRAHEVWVMQPGHNANHLWDCEVYAVAAGRVLGVERLRDGSGSDGATTVPAKPKRPVRPQQPSAESQVRSLTPWRRR